MNEATEETMERNRETLRTIDAASLVLSKIAFARQTLSSVNGAIDFGNDAVEGLCVLLEEAIDTINELVQRVQLT